MGVEGLTGDGVLDVKVVNDLLTGVVLKFGEGFSGVEVGLVGGLTVILVLEVLGFTVA